MSEISIRVESIALSSSPTTSSGQIDTPNQQGAAQGGSDPLSTVQRAAKIGDSVPIVFGRRVGATGGVLVSPPATEARFSNNSSNDVTASYHLVISEGQIDPIQVRDVFQQSCRVGSFTQAYNRRAGTWGPGNVITAQTGFESSVPDCPIYCGSGTGSYAGMTTGSFTVTIPHPFTQWDRQVHAFLRGGMWVPRLLESNSEGPSNNVSDLVRWMLRRSSRVPEALIDQSALLAAARFVNANGLFCNIKIDDPSNLADWLAGNLGYFLLRESRSGGKKGLRPLLPFNATTGAINVGTVAWVFTFTEDHILPGSIEINYSSRVERLPFCAQMVWRQQPEDGLGLARTAELRFSGSALDGPFEQHDLSAFATTENHAFKVGAYIVARRRYIDHRLTFVVQPGSFNATLAPGDLVRVRLRRVASVGENSIHDYLYEVERVGRAVTGEVTLELTHFPVDDQGRSLVARHVVAAVGNGLMLPTGRAAVSCDLNAADDTSFETDFGPWDGWDITIPDPVIGGDFDLGDGWGPGFEEDVNVDFTEPGWETDWEWDGIGEEWFWTGDENWQWNDGTGEFDWVGDGSPVGDPPDATPPAYSPDGAFTGGGDGGGGDGGAGYTATVSFSTPLLTYPEVWYGIMAPNFASVSIDVTVDNPPIDGALQVAITDGSVNAFDPENGQFGGGNSYSVVIPEGETSARITVNAWGESVDAATARTFAVLSAAGGGYEASTDPVAPALDLTATAPFNVEAYVGTISLQQPGVWTHDGTGWVWAGPADTGDWTWDEGDQEWTWGPDPASTLWEWVLTQQRWTYIGGAVTGWTWVLVQQRWRRTLAPDDETLAEKPADPPEGPPSPAPSEVTPAGKSYTVVARASVDNPAIPNGANNLEIDLQDFFIDEDDPANSSTVAAGTLVIPAISMMFGGWRWNPSADVWQYPTQSNLWRWHPADAAWEFLGDAVDWTWNGAEEEWQGGTGSPPPMPPQQFNSTFPPDAARWIYADGAWAAPLGGEQTAGGTAPDFTGLLSGTFTYHM